MCRLSEQTVYNFMSRYLSGIWCTDMRHKERDKALELRIKHKLGYATIAKQINVSKSTLSRWLKDLPLTEERIRELRRENWSKGEAGRELFRQTMRKKREEKDAQVYIHQRRRLGPLSRQSLFVAGLMLYLAEGDKKDSYHIGFANTDPEIIGFFLWWLRIFLKVPKSRIRVQLHLYESMKLDVERRFWVKQTNVPREQFYKDQIRQYRPHSFSYSESFRHGTCKIYVNGRKEKVQLALSIKAFFDTYRDLRV